MPSAESIGVHGAWGVNGEKPVCLHIKCSAVFISSTELLFLKMEPKNALLWLRYCSIFSNILDMSPVNHVTNGNLSRHC